MPTLTELRTEPGDWWDREIVTPELAGLAADLCAHYGVPRINAGTKGDVNHLRGSHRSQEWIRKSRYCTNRAYTVQSGLSATQERWVAGLDIMPHSWGSAENERRMIALSRRTIAAMRGGVLWEVREFLGTVDGRNVTGYSNVFGRTISGDSSHLEHGHYGIDRRWCDRDNVMAKLFRTITGTVPAPAPVPSTGDKPKPKVGSTMFYGKIKDDPRVYRCTGETSWPIDGPDAWSGVQKALAVGIPFVEFASMDEMIAAGGPLPADSPTQVPVEIDPDKLADALAELRFGVVD